MNENPENSSKEYAIESDSDSVQDRESLNTVMEYNRKLLEKIQQLEKSNQELKQKTEKPKEEKGTNQTFEFPIGEMLNSCRLSNESDPPETIEQETNDNTNNEESESGKIRISDGDRDDIIVKVDATRKGITLTLHIPRN